MVGAVLYCDIEAIKQNAGEYPLLIGGSNPLKSEIALLAKQYLKNKVVALNDEISNTATAIGQLSVYKNI